MLKPKVSVIIPVYNTEAYLTEALGSVMAQSVRELEIIVINDGSTDGSLEVIECLAAQDSRIKVFSQPNSGQSVARNFGISRARGEYIYFMDSDDRIDADTFELCYAKCESENLDFVIFDADVFYQTPGFVNKFDYRRSDKIANKIFTGLDLLDVLLSIRGYTVSPCLNLINADYLRRIAITFYPGIIHEDELFSAQLYIPASRVGAIDRTFFHRRVRPSSVMTSGYSHRTIVGYTTVLEQLDLYSQDKPKRTRNMIRRLMKELLAAVMYNAYSMPREERLALMRTGITKYVKLINLKSLLVLLFPVSKRLKLRINKQAL